MGETNAVLRDAISAVSDGVDVTVDRLGPYPSGDVDALLTTRRREVLAVARELGYYDTPHGATHGDIADRIGLSAGPVTEHLQRSEASGVRPSDSPTGSPEGPRRLVTAAAASVAGDGRWLSLLFREGDAVVPPSSPLPSGPAVAGRGHPVGCGGSRSVVNSSSSSSAAIRSFVSGL
jgi:hypothetical protein